MSVLGWHTDPGPWVTWGPGGWDQFLLWSSNRRTGKPFFHFDFSKRRFPIFSCLLACASKNAPERLKAPDQVGSWNLIPDFQGKIWYLKPGISCFVFRENTCRAELESLIFIHLSICYIETRVPYIGWKFLAQISKISIAFMRYGDCVNPSLHCVRVWSLISVFTTITR